MIRIAGLSKSFGARAGAVNDLSLDVPVGVFCALVGPSGCGKTTTLRCIAGLERPDQGEIAAGGKIVFSARDGINIPAHRRGFGMVFQSYAIWPHMTVAENVAYPLRSLRRSRAEIAEAVGWALGLVGLTTKADRPAPLLSGGEQQRVALARAVVERPSLLLLDEPLSNLDAKLREEMRFELRELQRRLGFTAIHVTHDQEEALYLADVLAIMHQGRIVEFGSPNSVYQSPRSAVGAEFLGTGTKLPGTVIGRNGAALTIRTALGDLPCAGAETLAEGIAVLVYLRPEDLLPVAAGDSAAGPIVEAKVTRIAMLGGMIEWWAEAGGTVLRGRCIRNTGPEKIVRQASTGVLRLSVVGGRCLPQAAPRA